MALWTPAEFGADLLIWLNPRDTGSLTIDVPTGRVTAWGSRTSTGTIGFTVNLTTSTATGPLPNNGIGGTQTLGWSASKMTGSMGVTLPTGDAPAYTAFVAAPSGTSTQKLLIFGGGAGLFRTFGARSGYADFGTGAADHTLASPSPAFNTARIVAQLTGGGQSVAHLDGSTTTYSKAFAYNISGAANIILGMWDTGGENFTGQYGEVVYIDRAPTTDERNKLDGYLAWGAGLQANLPTSHPYYGAAPTTGATVVGKSFGFVFG